MTYFQQGMGYYYNRRIDGWWLNFFLLLLLRELSIIYYYIYFFFSSFLIYLYYILLFILLLLFIIIVIIIIISPLMFGSSAVGGLLQPPFRVRRRTLPNSDTNIAMASNSSTASGKCTLLADTSSGAPLLFAGLSEERKVVCYNLLTKEKIQDYIGHTLTVSCIAVSMRHRLVCSGSSDSTVRVYKMSSGQQLRKYNHGDVVTTMLLAGNVLVTGSVDTTIIGSDVASGKSLFNIKDHKGSVEALSCNDDGTYFASGSANDGLIRVGKVIDGSKVCQVSPCNDGVSSLAFGTRVLVAGFDSAKISVFRFSPGESKLEAAYELNSNKTSHSGPLYGLALSGDSTLASYGGPGDTCVCVWNIDSDVEERGGPQQTITYAKNCSSVAFMGDLLVATSTFHKTTNVWKRSSNTWEEAMVLDEAAGGEEYGATASCPVEIEGKQHLVTFPEALGKVHVYDMDTKERTMSLTSRVDRVMAFAVSPCGEYMFTSGEYNHDILVWNLTTSVVKSRLKAHQARVCCLEAFEDGTLLSGGDDKTCIVWNWKKGVDNDKV